MTAVSCQCPSPGGGDGALLFELLKTSPSHVTMIDIDPRVMDSVRRHMPSVAGGEPPPRNGGVLWSVDCGGVLQESKGRDYDIIVGDAIDYMEAYNRQGKMFDYVFGDLTDVPIDATGGEIILGALPA